MFYYIDELNSIAYRQAIENVAQFINVVLETDYNANDWIVLEEVSRRLGIAYNERGEIVSYMPNFKEDVQRVLDSLIGIDTGMDAVKFNLYLKELLNNIRKQYMVAYLHILRLGERRYQYHTYVLRDVAYSGGGNRIG